MTAVRAVGAVAAVLLLAGCAISQTHHRPGTSHAVATGAPSYDSNGRPYGTSVTITIAGGRVTPPPGRVEVRRGQTVHLVVTSDRADEAHVHGYDIEVPLAAGVPATIEFTADQTGVFEVETHESDLTLIQLLVR
jgi:hypothetical protein